MAVNVRSDDIDLRDDQVVIDNADLKDLIEKDKDQALDLLRSEVGAINLDDIDFDDSGRLVINNKAFANTLRQKVGAPRSKTGGTDEGNNLLCGYGC
jgi:hypothetical protein